MLKSRVKVKIREKILELTELAIQKTIKRKWKVAEWLPEKEGKKKLKNAENKKVGYSSRTSMPSNLTVRH